jgi:hypothetical protein
MGPELFDYAFKQYAERWAFKHPSPADFFRTMEDASAVDLDWFWKGWFYTTDNVDIEVSDINWYKYANQIQDETAMNAEGQDKKKRKGSGRSITGVDNKGYTPDDQPSPEEKLMYPMPLKTSINETEGAVDPNKNFYEVKLKNQGGLVMPVIMQFNYKDGSSEIKRIPAEIWRQNEDEISKVFVLDKEVDNVVLDPFKETADVNEANNHFPPKEIQSDFQKYKEGSNED